MPALLIHAGRVIDPASGLDATTDVLVVDGRIAALAPKLDAPAGSARINADGLIVAPGLIDPHVHLRQPGHEHRETIAGGTRAAVAGGFTALCCMPNTDPPIDSPQVLAWVRARAARDANCRVFAVAAASRERAGREPAPIAELARAGAVGFSDDGDCLEDAAVLREVMERSRAAGRPFMQHAQDRALTTRAPIHAGPVAVRFGVPGWPRVAETSVVQRDIELARRTGCAYHVQHVSCAETVALIRSARREGLRVSGEASPHHLALTVDDCVTPCGHGLDPNFKMNPPLRDATDVQALREGVADGSITILATDHAPHAAHEKDRPFEEAPFGIVGLETALPLYAQTLVRTGLIAWPRLIALMTIEPARLCGLDRAGSLGLGEDGLGEIRAGGPADLTVIDPEAEWTLRAANLAGTARNTPFAGRPLRGRAVATIVAGMVRAGLTAA